MLALSWQAEVTAKVHDRSTGKVCASAHLCFALPDNFPFVDAAAFIMTYATSHHALVDRAQLRAGETVLVLGAAGGVGTAAIQVAKALGARVIAAIHKVV